MRIKLQLLVLIAATLIIAGACRKSATNQIANSNAATPQETLGGGAAPAGEKFYFRGSIANL